MVRGQKEFSDIVNEKAIELTIQEKSLTIIFPLSVNKLCINNLFKNQECYLSRYQEVY